MYRLEYILQYAGPRKVEGREKRVRSGPVSIKRLDDVGSGEMMEECVVREKELGEV
jgi:hypothetical protein